MKRFYCTVCKKVKRVRNLPASIDTQEYLRTLPDNRIGQCSHHTIIIKNSHVSASQFLDSFKKGVK